MRTRYVAVALAVSLAACADDTGGGLVIRQNLAPPETGCIFQPEATSPYFARGTISMFSPSPYVMTPLIESRITAMDGMESQRTVLVRGARVDLRIEGATADNASIDITAADFPAGSLKFTSLFSAPVAPNGGLSVGDFDLVPTAVIAELRSRFGNMRNVNVQLVGAIKVYGDLGGDEVESDSFEYPVTVCTDCIVNNIGECPSPDTVRTGNPCNPFQDGIVDCCTQANGLLCPASVDMQ